MKSAKSIFQASSSLTAVAILFLLAPVTATARARKDVPAAPLPDSIAKAHKVFLTNGGGSELAFDEFYAQMKQWGRFSIVGSPADAEIIIQLQYAVIDKGPRIHSTTDTYTNQTTVHSRELTDPQLTLNIYDSATKSLLWSDTDHRRLARREKNREKETILSADRIVEQLRQRIDLPQ